MDTFDAIKTRRAIKKFDSSYKMSSEDIKLLQELTILSPTSYNQQNWRFVYVTDQVVKEKISKARGCFSWCGSSPRSTRQRSDSFCPDKQSA